MEHETIINHHPEGITLPPEEELAQAARFLRTIGDPTKLRIVCVLAGIGADGEGEREREICAGSIAAALGMTSSAISHQLKILRDEMPLPAPSKSKGRKKKQSDSNESEVEE